jgi:hypothetical protein
MAVVVEKRYLRPALSLNRQSWNIPPDTDDTFASLLASMTAATLLLVKEWVAVFAEKKNLTLRIYDDCHHELSFNPRKYCYGGTKWFLLLIGKLFPSPDLWIMLDVSTNVSQFSSQMFFPAETLGLCEDYRSFVKTRRRYIILDAGKPPVSVTEEAYAAIVDTLSLCTERQLRNRFL